MLKNKHLITALIVAPILSIIAYFAVGHFVAEKPSKAQPGNSYPLVELPGCRYSGGNCRLKNADFELAIQARTETSGHLSILVESQHPLQGIKLALAQHSQRNPAPTSMEAADNHGKRWKLSVTMPTDKNTDDEHHLRLAALANNAIYFGETGLNFMPNQGFNR